METILTEEDIYNFDTAGWLHLPAVLTVSEQRAATAAVEAAGDDEAAHTLHSPGSRAFLLARQLFLRCSLWAL